MLETMVKIAKDHQSVCGQNIIRLDMNYNNIDCAWSARVFYSDNHIIDIKQTEDGLKVFKEQ